MADDITQPLDVFYKLRAWTGWKGSLIPAAIAALVQAHADRQHPLPASLAHMLLQVLDALVDLGDRRSAALQQSESFRGVRLDASTRSAL
jgi:hypothetical protein